MLQFKKLRLSIGPITLVALCTFQKRVIHESGSIWVQLNHDDSSKDESLNVKDMDVSNG